MLQLKQQSKQLLLQKQQLRRLWKQPQQQLVLLLMLPRLQPQPQHHSLQLQNRFLSKLLFSGQLLPALQLHVLQFLLRYAKLLRSKEPPNNQFHFNLEPLSSFLQSGVDPLHLFQGVQEGLEAPDQEALEVHDLEDHPSVLEVLVVYLGVRE